MQVKRVSLAPMIDKSKPRFRFLIRKLFPEIQLYTEMISSGAIIHGCRERFLQLHECEAPIALQIGTHCPEEAYQAVQIACEFSAQNQGQSKGQDKDKSKCSFNEFNLNAGCPSDRVQNRNIGAILMSDAPLVAEILAAMRQAVCDTQAAAGTLITLKHRLGIQSSSVSLIQEEQLQERLYDFLEKVTPHCDRLIVHARIAMLEGLNPKQNREIPPLNYPLTFQIRQDFAPIPVELNGGLQDPLQIEQVWQHIDGVMLGRLSYEDTWKLQKIRQHLLEHKLLPPRSGGVSKRSELVEHYRRYLVEHPSTQSIAAQIWPLLTLWSALPQAKHWRRLLSPPYGKHTASELAQLAHDYILQLEEEYPQHA